MESVHKKSTSQNLTRNSHKTTIVRGLSDGTTNNAWRNVPNPGEDKTFTHILRLHLFAGGDINGGTRDADERSQISLYEEGIGGKTKLGPLMALRGIAGRLSRQTKPMQKRLEEVYQPGDKLYLVGYSRGAASARKFAADLHKNGLTMKNGVKVEQPPIEFVGCFETVSSQIVTRILQLLITKFSRKITSCRAIGEEGVIAPNVKKGVHNVAIDDNRMWKGTPFTFNPILMGDEEKITETWFAGEHGDVGGSYYSKGMPDCSLKYMMEWMEGGLGEENKLEFLKAEDIKPESLVIDDYPADFNVTDLKINAADLSVSPDTTDRIHLNQEGQNEPNNPSYRPVYVVKDDKMVEGATVKIHASVLQHMEDMKKAGKKYNINPKIKDTDFVVVGALGRELRDETKKLAELLSTDYA